VTSHATQRTLASISLVIAAVNVLSLLLDPRDHAYRPLFVTDLAHGVIAIVIAIAAARARAPWSETTSDLVFVVVTVPFLVGLWLPQSFDASRGTAIDPMLAHHFLLFGIAVSAPSWRSGVAMISVFTIHAIVLWHTLTGAVSAPALDREPWFSVFFAVIASMLLYTRERRRGLEQRLAAAEARAGTLTQVSRLLLALRDRANSPLQTLEIAIAMLEQQHRVEDLLPPMRRALARLVAIQQTLAIDELRAADLDVPLDLEAALRELLVAPRSDESA
jgi:hypothetical protein